MHSEKTSPKCQIFEFFTFNFLSGEWNGVFWKPEYDVFVQYFLKTTADDEGDLGSWSLLPNKRTTTFIQHYYKLHFDFSHFLTQKRYFGEKLGALGFQKVH